MEIFIFNLKCAFRSHFHLRRLFNFVSILSTTENSLMQIDLKLFWETCIIILKFIFAVIYFHL